MVERGSSRGGVVARWTVLSFVRLFVGGGELSFSLSLLLVCGGEAVGEGVARDDRVGKPRYRAAGGKSSPRCREGWWWRRVAE